MCCCIKGDVKEGWRKRRKSLNLESFKLQRFMFWSFTSLILLSDFILNSPVPCVSLILPFGLCVTSSRRLHDLSRLSRPFTSFRNFLLQRCNYLCCRIHVRIHIYHSVFSLRYHNTSRITSRTPIFFISFSQYLACATHPPLSYYLTIIAQPSKVAHFPLFTSKLSLSLSPLCVLLSCCQIARPNELIILYSGITLV